MVDSAEDLEEADSEAVTAMAAAAVEVTVAETATESMAEVVAAARELGCGPTHVYALLRQYLDDPRLTSLLPRPRGRKVGTTLLDAAVEALIEAAIDEVYLTRQRARLVELTVEVQRRCVAGGLAPEGILACDRVARTRSGCQRSDSRSGI